MNKLRLITTLWLFLLSSYGHAATITYSGMDLYSTASFPTLTPTLNGTSLVFGTGASVRNQKLLVLPIFPEGYLPQTSSTEVSITINLTRLPCVISAGCAGGEIDSDPQFVLSDGTNLFGGSASDGLGGAGDALTLNDLGDAGGLISSQTIFTDAGYPAINSSFDVNLDFIIRYQPYGDTSMSLSFLDGSGTAGFPGFMQNAPVKFLLLKEGDPGEQYQINSLTITSDALTAIPIPAALWLFSSGLMGFIGIARKKAA